MFTASSLWPFIDPGLPSLPPRRGQRGSHVPDSVGRWGAGLFQEKPHSLQNNVRTSLEKKKRGSGVSWASRPETTAQGEWVGSVDAPWYSRVCLYVESGSYLEPVLPWELEPVSLGRLRDSICRLQNPHFTSASHPD